MQRFVMWFLKVKLQSKVMPESLTVWVLQSVYISIDRNSEFFYHFGEIFPGFVLIEIFS